MKKVLTIAGSDPSGGAGIQADLKTMTALKTYGMSAITALTAQNTLGVQGVQEVPENFLALELDCIFEDIRPDAVKIGMVSSVALIQVIADKLAYYKAKNVVLDPVMVATSGDALISDGAVQGLIELLFPQVSLITPNIPEIQVLTGERVSSARDMEKAAKLVYDRYGVAVLCKGGHQLNDANDVLCNEEGLTWFKGKRIDNPNTHGTGCTLSSAIAAYLAKGETMAGAIEKAKAYLSGALEAQLDLGHGSGPLDHMYGIQEL